MAYAGTEESSVSLRDVLFVLFWHRTTILLIACAVFGGVLVGLFLWEESYEARASILVKLGRQGMTLNAVLPPSSQQSGIPVGVRKEDVNSEIEILQNRALIEQAVTKLGPEFFFPESQPPEALIPWVKYMVKQGLGNVRKGITEVLIAVDLKTRISPREQAILSVQDGLAAKVIRDSDVIELIFKWGSPELAQATLEALVALYLERHVETHRSSEAPAFLHKQVETIKARLQDSEEKLEALKKKQNITNFGDQQKFLLGETTKVKALLKQAETEQAEISSKLTQLRDRLKSQPEYIEVTKDQARNTLLDSLKQRLLDLEMEKMKQEARFESTSRPVREVEDKIQEVKSRLSQESTRVMDRVTTGLNVVYQETRKDMLLSEVALIALQVKRETLFNHLGAYTKELGQLQSYDMELNRLQRQIKLDEESFVLYKRKLEESEISTLLDTEKVVNVRVVEPALAGAVPVNQKKKSLILLLGGVVSLFVGVCGAYFLEYIDHSLRSPEHVTRYLGLRVLASVEEAKG
ncbi:MAG: GumC family protein [Nitrospirae bacterium]|nr:GumC family protein [Nitrospirota bacterium]